jgi:hypothetical protein
LGYRLRPLSEAFLSPFQEYVMKCMMIVVLLSTSVVAQEFQLLPGETLVAIDGVPISAPQLQVCTGPNCQAQGPIRQILGVDGAIINRDPVAFAHAQREAEMIAAMGANYYRGPGRGHPLGVAPGCRYSGTGYTWDMNRPGHCYENELPESRIVARARARGVNGAWFWSAHYK